MSVESQEISKNPSRHFAPVGIIFGLFGLLLFVYLVHRSGFGEVVAGIQRLGLGFLIVLAISSIRYIVRSLAWVKCVESPYHLRFRDALAARLMGDALGNFIPLASVAVSEPSKALFVKDRLPLVVAMSGLVIENLFYGLSVAFFIFAGTATLVLNYSVPKGLSYASLGVLVITLLTIVSVFFLIHRELKLLSGALRFLSKRGAGKRWAMKFLPRAETLEDRIYGFYRRNQRNFITILAFEITFHAIGVAEIYTTLSFVSPVPPTLLTAFILESVNRIINVGFKFVPLRTGVDEAGTGLLSKVLGFATATGVTLAIIRKGRDIFWAGIGVLLLLRKGVSIREDTDSVEIQLQSGRGGDA